MAGASKKPHTPVETASQAVPYVMTNQPAGLLPDMSGFTWQRAGSVETGWSSRCPIQGGRDLLEGETLSALLVNLMDGEMTEWRFTPEDNALSVAQWPEAFAASIAASGLSMTAGQWQDGAFAAQGDALRLWNHAKFRSFTTAPFAGNLVQALACNDAFQLGSGQTLSLQVRDLTTQHLYEQHFFTPEDAQTGQAWSEALCKQVNLNSHLIRAGVLDAACTVTPAATANAFWVPQCAELCLTLNECHWWAARAFNATDPLAEGESITVQVYDAFSHRLLDQFVWTPALEQRPADQWPSAWAEAVRDSSVGQWLHVGESSTPGSMEVASGSTQATLWHRGEGIRICTSLPDAENWLPGPRLDEAWGDTSDAVMLTVRHCANQKLMHLDVFIPESAVTAAEDQDGWLDALQGYMNGLQWPLIRVGHEDANGQLDRTATASGALRIWSSRFAEVIPDVHNVGDAKRWKSSRYADYLLPIDDLPNQPAPTRLVNAVLNMKTQFSRRRACVVVGWLMGDLEFRLSQAAIGKGYSIADCARAEARDGMLSYDVENTQVPVEVSAERIVWRGRIKNSVYEILLDYPESACDATELVIGYAGVFTEGLFWQGVQNVSFTPPAAPAAYIPSSALCEDYGNTFRSEVFDVSGQSETGVDRRTGLFHAHYPVATLHGLEGLGPVCDLTMHYSALRGNEAGLGDGWAWRFASLEHRDRRLIMADGVQVDFTESEWSDLAKGQPLTKSQCVIRSNADYSEVTLNLPSGRQEILSKPNAEGSDEQEPNDALRQEILRLLRAIKAKSKPEYPAKPEGFQQQALLAIWTVGYYGAATLDWNAAVSAWEDRVQELDQRIAYYERPFVQLLPSRIVSIHGKVLTLTWKRQQGQFLLQTITSGTTSLFEATYTATEATFDIWKSSAAERCTVKLELANYLLQKVQRFQGNDTSALLHEAQYGYCADPTLDRVLNQVRELDGSSEFVRYTPEAFTFSDKRPALPAVQQHVIIVDRDQQSVVSDYTWKGSYLRDEYFACGVTKWSGGDSSADFHVFDRAGRQVAYGDASEAMITVFTEAQGRSLIKYPAFYIGEVQERVGERVHAFLTECSNTVPSTAGDKSEGYTLDELIDGADEFDDLLEATAGEDSTQSSTPPDMQVEADLVKIVKHAMKHHDLTFEALSQKVVTLLASCTIDPLRQRTALAAAAQDEALLTAMRSMDWDDFFRRYRFSAPILSFVQRLNLPVHAEKRAASHVQVTDKDTEIATLSQSCKCNEQDQVIFLKDTDGCRAYRAYYVKGANSVVCPLVSNLPTLECPDIPPDVPSPLMAEYQCDPFGNPLSLTLYGYRSVKRNERDVLEIAHKVVIEGVSATLNADLLDATTAFSLVDEDKPALVRCSSTSTSPVSNKTEKPDCKVKVWSITDEQKTSLGEDVMSIVTVQSFEDNPNAAGIHLWVKVTTVAGTAVVKEEVRSRLTHRCLQRLQDGIDEHWQYDALARIVERKRYRLLAGTKADKKAQKPEHVLSILYSSDSRLETVTQHDAGQVRNHKDGLGRTVSTQWRPHDKASFVPISERQFVGLEPAQMWWGSSWDYLPGGQAILTSTTESEAPGNTPWNRQIEGSETTVEYGLGEQLRARHRQRTEQLQDGGFQRSDIQEDAQGRVYTQIQRQYDGNGNLVALQRTLDGVSSKTTLLRDALGRVTKMTRSDGSVIERSYKGFSTQVVELKVDSVVIATQELDLPSTLTARTVGTRRYALGHDQVTLPDQTLLSFAQSGEAMTYQASDLSLAQLTLDREKVVFATGSSVKPQATTGTQAPSASGTSKAQASETTAEASSAEEWSQTICAAKLPGAHHVEERGPRGTVSRLQWQSLRGTTVAVRLADGHMLRRFDDRWGRPLRTCKDHEEVRFIHDEFGNLISRHVHALRGGGQWQVCSQFDAFDQETWRTFKRNDSMTFEQRFTWNSAGMLKTKQSGTWQQVLRTEAYEYDALDRLERYSCTAGASQHLPRDTTGQPVKLQAFAWDALSNMTQCITTYSNDTTSTVGFSYADKDPTRLTVVQRDADTRSLAWDSNGYMTTDAEGRTLGYTPDGRLKQICDSQQTVLTRYDYDGHERLVAQYVADDQSTRELRYDGDELIGEIWYDKSGKPGRALSFSKGLATYENASVRWLIDDPQSGVVGEVMGDTLTVHALLPFGEAPDAEAPTIGYNGMRRDPVTGHYHSGNGYRCYDPTLCRYLQPDWLSPFGEGGLNDYVHCPDPVNWHDPSGAIMMSRWGQARTIDSLEQFLSDVQPMPVGSRWRGLAMSALLTFVGVASVVLSGGATSAWVIAALVTLNLVSFGLEVASVMLEDSHPDIARKLGIASGVTGVLSIGNPMGIVKLLGKGLRASALFGVRIARRVGLTLARGREAFRMTRLRGFRAGRRTWHTAPDIPKVLSRNYGFDTLGEPRMRGFNVVPKTYRGMGARVNSTSLGSSVGDFSLADQYEITRGWKADYLWSIDIGTRAGRLVYQAADLYGDLDDLLDGADLVLPEDKKIGGDTSLKGRMAKFRIDVRDGQKGREYSGARSPASIAPGSD
ncbi:hypothetical protein IAE35_17190 [Pseudomonas sp. S75]|uniref:RHS repeat-associated core domain-containing protein n=1 Tax=unclassified Pseudomonas TaxID=196821 RepID=UPI00190813AD|nr:MULTISPECIES: RHS repeat-associated core domain-containing protein [unclassified Pseudomonas]MBJ9977706.1 hypothetical protein [Pseudomonas sp. S30]MBK0155078.1 hypothetical protein [Pseudomonas sp. S75]